MSATETHTLVVSPEGEIRWIHDDALRPLEDAVRSGQTIRIGRASHVEPVSDANGIGWTADMSPVEGPVLGPFDSRAEALTAEKAWLLEHNIPFPTGSR